MDSSWPWLPVEIYTHILTFLPPSHSTSDSSIDTLLACLASNSRLRAAARVSAVWEPHYRARYTTCVDEWEAQRREETGGNWYEMYVVRRRLDKRALELVDDIRVHPAGRHEKVTAFTRELSFDVWDALEFETVLPVPVCFRAPPEPSTDPASMREWENLSEAGTVVFSTKHEQQEDYDEADVPPHALPRRYWAKTVMGVIARSYALRFWTRLYGGDESVTFEEVLAGLSAFFDVLPKKVFAQLDEIAANCKTELLAEHFELDQSHTKYNLLSLCVRLRRMLHGMGFEVVRGGVFYQPMNQFPHWFLQENHRQTIPMSVAYVFVAVARRLGIQAAPTNFPGKIQVHVTSPNPKQGDMLVDFVTNAPPLVFSSRDPSRMLADAGLPSDSRPDFVCPCSITKMLTRSATNIITAVRFQRMGFLDIYTETYENASYAACIALLLDTQDPQTIALVVDVMPLDAVAILRDIITPALNDVTRGILAQRCRAREEEDEARAVRTSLRSEHNVKYFVGLIFTHVQFKYVGCIIGWQPRCMASAEWIEAMQVKKLARGPDQPFYSVIGTDGGKRYVAEDNIQPSRLTQDIAYNLFAKRATFSRYFEGAEIGQADGSAGRLLMVEELRNRYPEDEEAGKFWSTKESFRVLGANQQPLPTIQRILT